jgi:uncharacterized protein
MKVLEAFLPQYMAHVADSRQANLSWQGGEPTLAGLDFFRQVVSLEAEYAPRPISISNTVQTNGLLIDDRWTDFFAEYKFLVGVSLDGPEWVHDAERRDLGGNGSFRRAMTGIAALKRRGVDLNILCVLTQHNVRHAAQTAHFFKNEGLDYLQFMPAMTFKAAEPQAPAAYLVSAAEYGAFLTELFDQWYGDGVPTFSVRTFNNILQSFVGVENDLCIHAETCRGGMVVESNGDVYPCDFYIHMDWKLGNILKDRLESMLAGARLRDFCLHKSQLPAACRACGFVNLCRGECPRNRRPGPDGEPGPSYFCSSYKRLFEHSLPRFREIADRVRNYRRYLALGNERQHQAKPVLADDAPCPCDSGRAFKTCCGDFRLARCYLFQPAG